MPPTATGGIVVGLKVKAAGFEPACDAPTMAVLNAVVLPVKLPVPATSSLAAGAVTPMPKLPALDITNDLLGTAAPFSYRKNPNVSTKNADCCNSQKLFGRVLSSNRITGAALRMCSFLCGLVVPIPKLPALLTTNDLAGTAAPFS